MTARSDHPLRLVTTLSADLAALGVPDTIVARARAYEADHRRLSLIERAAREVVDSIDATANTDADGMDDAFAREEDALAALRDHLGRWA
jgi:hypothetical protein